MKIYRLTLPHGVETTVQMDEAEAKKLGLDEVEITADVSRPGQRKSRNAEKETR